MFGFILLYFHYDAHNCKSYVMPRYVTYIIYGYTMKHYHGTNESL